MNNKLIGVIALASMNLMPDAAEGNGAQTEQESSEKKVLFELEQNGVKLNIVEKKISKGQTAGTPFFTIDESQFTDLDVLKFFPQDKFFEGFLFPNLHRAFYNMYKEASATANGSEDVLRTEFEKLVKEFSLRQESIRSLNERKNELLQDLKDIAAKMQKDPTFTAQFIECATKIANIEKAISDKRSKDDDDSENKAPASANTEATTAQA